MDREHSTEICSNIGKFPKASENILKYMYIKTFYEYFVLSKEIHITFFKPDEEKSKTSKKSTHKFI